MSVKNYFNYLRYEFARGVIDIGVMLLPKGATKREIDILIDAWKDIKTSKKFREQLERTRQKEIAGLIHKIAKRRLDGLVSDYQERFVESAKKFMPEKYDKLLKNIISDFYYSGYTLSDEEVRMLMNISLDKKALILNYENYVVDPYHDIGLDDLIAQRTASGGG
jgi:hypothetical protein